MTGCCRIAGLLGGMAMLLGACNEPAPAFTEPLTLGGREVSPETLNQGRDLYFKYCVSCHGETGAGDGPAARSLKFPPRDFRLAQFSFVEADPARADSGAGQLPTHQELVDRIRSGPCSTSIAAAGISGSRRTMIRRWRHCSRMRSSTA
jgi:hypothetical protein